MFPISRQVIGASCAFCLCMLGVGGLQCPRLQSMLKAQDNITTETLQRELDLEKLRLQILNKLPSFGFSNLVANLVYINFLNYFGDDAARNKTDYSLSPEYFTIIIDRDPKFIQAYLGLSTSTSMYAAMPERAVELIEKGLKSLKPQAPKYSYYIWRYKGIDELLFLGNSQAAKTSFANASDWASSYADKKSKNVAYFSRTTSEFLSRKPDSKKAQIGAWVMILNHQVDQKGKERAIKGIEALGGRVIPQPDSTHSIQLPPED
ncbi:MAG: hypothetical protein HRU34_04425 [Richelia sp.]|nr:hypothetical protein [Richelia sp.]CDN12654.1 hypothetical protein RintRC_6730 [Richelia intracellularis]